MNLQLRHAFVKSFAKCAKTRVQLTEDVLLLGVNHVVLCGGHMHVGRFCYRL